jgi:hypothetical protein
MRKSGLIFFLLCFITIDCYSQLQIGGGPALFLNESFKEHQYSSIDYSLTAGYVFNKFDAGFEFVQNEYRDDGWGKDYYEFYQYQLFGRFYPLKKRSWFIKAGINYSDERYHNSLTRNDSLYKFDEHGKLFGLEGGLGFQDRLIKNIDIFLNASLTYNYLKVLDYSYVNTSHKVPLPFYALKVSLIYQYNLKKRK